MKSDTKIWMAIRNIGDSDDKGYAESGELRVLIMELAKRLAKMDMKRRIAIGFGRNETDARMATRIKGDPNTEDSDLMADLTRIMNEGVDPAEREGDEPELAMRIPGDDYQPTTKS